MYVGSITRKMWIVGWLSVTVFIKLTSQNGCEMVSSISSYALNGHTYQTKAGIRLLTCIVTCQDDDRCHSTNFKRTSQECELNNSSRLETPQDFGPASDTVYLDNLYRPYQPCDNSPCQNGGTCLITGGSKAFQCKCYPGYAGDKCEDCSWSSSRALGMQSGEIENWQVKATSSQLGYRAYKARLHGSSSWRSKDNDTSEYLEIDFAPDKKFLTGIQTQGDPQADNWVTQYSLSYSQGGVWKNVTQMQDDDIAIFIANYDRNTPSLQIFNEDINATALRVHPRSWHGYIALRFDLFGC